MKHHSSLFISNWCRRLVTLYFALFLLFVYRDSWTEYGYSATPQVNEILKEYKKYLDSFGKVSYTMKIGRHTSRISYNGQFFHSISTRTDSPDYVLETNWNGCLFSLESDMSKERDKILLLAYRDPASDSRKMYENLVDPELLGFIHFGEPIGNAVIIELLGNLTSSKIYTERKNGMDIMLISGIKDDVDIKALFAPEQKFALREMTLTRSSGKFKPGDIVSYSFSFDKFTIVNSVPFPTECHWTLTQIDWDSGKERVHEDTTYFSDFSVEPNHNPQPYSFVTEVPNGTSVVAQDARQIEHIWYDGKIEPKTSELMLKIARGNHKFMPGPNEPRFWLMAIGIILIVVALGKKLYDIFYQRKEDEA